MSDPLANVVPGTPLLEAVTADRLNALSEVARHARRNQPIGSDRGDGGRVPDSVTLLVRNNTGTTFAINSAVQISDPLGYPASSGEYWQRGKVYEGVLPTAAGVIYGITEEPILNGQCGRVVVSGVVPVTLWVSDAAHTYANSTAASGELLTAYHGTARILWKESGTGSGKRGVVQLFPKIADAAASVPGLITIFDQVLGAGVKTADGYRVTNGVITNIISSSQITFDSTITGVTTTTEFVGGDKLNSRIRHYATDGNAIFEFNADNFTVGGVPMVSGSDDLGNTFTKGFCTTVGSGVVDFGEVP